MRIRRGELKDVEEILNLLKRTPELQPMGDGVDESLFSKEYVRDYINDKRMNLVLVAEEDENILGFILAEIWSKKRYSFLTDIVVKSEAKGRAVGKKLFERYEDYCKKKGIKNIHGLVQTKNKGMQEFSKKVGLRKGNSFYYYVKEI